MGKTIIISLKNNYLQIKEASSSIPGEVLESDQHRTDPKFLHRTIF